MNFYDSIIFDLDGTLWDASDSCAKGWNAALLEYGVTKPIVTPDDIRSISGLPFQECVDVLFSNVDGIDCKKISSSIDSKEQHYVTRSGGVVYPDVQTGLDQLSNQVSLFLVSNCQSWYLESFWEHHNMKAFFQDCDCNGDSGLEKSLMIKNICERNTLIRPIYIGDTEGDQKASSVAGVSFGHASYGFGCVSDPDESFSDFKQLVKWFLTQHPSPYY